MKFLFSLFISLLSLQFAFAKPTPVSHLNFDDTGVREGTTILLLHAFPLNKNTWNNQVEVLKKKHRVITFDVRGFGKSKLTHPYTLEFVADDVIAILDHLKIDKVVIGGLSMGGFVALRAIERNPERFMGLVLANTKSEPDSDSSKLGRYKAIKTIQTDGLSAFVDGFIKPAVAPENTAASTQAKKISMENKAPGVAAGLLALTSRTDTTASLAKIAVPTLIIHGELDTVVPPSAAESLNKKIKGSQLFMIPKVGHLSNLENPKAFNEKLLEFLNQFKVAE